MRPPKLFPKVVSLPPSLLSFGPPGLEPAATARAVIQAARREAAENGMPPLEQDLRFNVSLTEEDVNFLAQCKLRGKISHVLRQLLERRKSGN